MKVFTSRSAWRGFLRRAKANFPKEHIEALWGHETVDTFRIVKFSRVRLKIDRLTGKILQSESELEYTRREIERQKKLAKEAGLKYLGTIHTHPDAEFDPSPSEEDHLSGIKDGDSVMGIVVLVKPKKPGARFHATPRWWFPQKPCTFEILPE
jgi:proteasome lid subunit RPN8/RPN11